MRYWVAIAIVGLGLLWSGEVRADQHPNLQQEEKLDAGEHHLPLEAYYNREFFNQPWSDVGYIPIIQHETEVVLVLEVIAWLVWRRIQRSA